MAIGKAWLSDVVDDLTSGGGPLTSDEADMVVRAIRKHSPFQQDMAYMPVPRCETCKSWGQPLRTMKGEGACAKMNMVAVDDGRDLLLVTRADFGCVKWEASRR